MLTILFQTYSALVHKCQYFFNKLVYNTKSTSQLIGQLMNTSTYNIADDNFGVVTFVSKGHPCISEQRIPTFDVQFNYQMNESTTKSELSTDQQSILRSH